MEEKEYRRMVVVVDWVDLLESGSLIFLQLSKEGSWFQCNKVVGQCSSPLENCHVRLTLKCSALALSLLLFVSSMQLLDSSYDLKVEFNTFEIKNSHNHLV